MAVKRTIFDAVRAGDQKEIHALLNEESINATDDKNFTPILLAAKLGSATALEAITTSSYMSRIDLNEGVNEEGVLDAISKRLQDEKATSSNMFTEKVTVFDYVALSDKFPTLFPLLTHIPFAKHPFKHGLLLAATFGKVNNVVALLASHLTGSHADNELLLLCCLNSEIHAPLADSLKLLEAVYKLATQPVIPWKSYESKTPEINMFRIKFSLPRKNLGALAAQRYQSEIAALKELLNAIENDDTKSQSQNRLRGMIAHLEYAKYFHSQPKDEDALRRACLMWKTITNPNDLFEDDKKLLAQQIDNTPVWLGGSYFHTLNKLKDEKGAEEKAVALDEKIDGVITYLVKRQSETGTKAGYSQTDYDARLTLAKTIISNQVGFHKNNNPAHLEAINGEIKFALTQGNLAGRFCRSRHLFADHLRGIKRAATTLIPTVDDKAKPASDDKSKPAAAPK